MVWRLKMVIAVIPPNTEHFSSLKLNLWGRLQRFILVNPLPFMLKVSKKKKKKKKNFFFITCNDILEKQVISLSWKKTHHNPYTIFLILLTKSMRKPNVQLAHFSYLFQVVADCELQFSSIFGWTAFHWKSILIKVWQVSWSGFISQWRTNRTKLQIQVLDLLMVNTLSLPK